MFSNIYVCVCLTYLFCVVCCMFWVLRICDSGTLWQEYYRDAKTLLYATLIGIISRMDLYPYRDSRGLLTLTLPTILIHF